MSKQDQDFVALLKILGITRNQEVAAMTIKGGRTSTQCEFDETAGTAKGEDE